MTTVANILRRARRRVMTADALHRAGVGLMIASGFALAALIGERAAGLGWPWWVYAIAMASGALLGALSALIVPPRRLDIAVKLDRTLGLRDRIASAEIARHQASHIGVFGPLVERDAERVAQRVDVRAATPIHITRVWFGVAGAALLLVIGIALMPIVDWSSQSNDSAKRVAMHTPETIEQQELIAETIHQAVAEVDTERPLDPDLQQELDRLSELAEQLTADTATLEELSAARDDSAATLNDIADRIADDAQRDLDATEAVAERFSGLEAADAPMSAQEFAQALRDGAFGDAASLFEDLKEDAESLAPAQREAMADALRDLGDQLAAPASPTDPADDADDDDLEALRDALSDLGLDEQQIDELFADDASRKEVEERLRNQDIDEDVARNVAQDVRDAAERQAAERQAEQTARDLSDAIDRAADEIDPTPPDEQPPPSDETSDQPDDQPDSDPQQTQHPTDAEPPDHDAQGEQPGAEQPGAERPGADQPAADQPGAADEGREGAMEQSDATGEQQRQPGGERTGKPGEEEQQQQQPGGDRPGRPGEEQQNESEQPGSGEERQQQQPGGEQTGAPPNPGQPDPANPEDPGDPGDPKEPARQPSEGSPIDPGSGVPQPGDPQSGDPKSGDPKSGGRRPTVEELLDELDKRQRGGHERARDSEQIRDAARRIAEQLTDEEKRELAERWMQNAHPDDETGAAAAGMSRRDPDSNDRPFTQTEQVDLRGDDDEPGEHIIAQWIDDQPLEGDPQRTTRSSKMIRSAQKAAEHAVEETVVPRRYHELIRRYFQRIPETVEKAATTTPEGAASNSGSSAQSSEGASPTAGNDS